MTANAELVGLAAITWRRLDVAALELETQAIAAGSGASLHYEVGDGNGRS